MCGSLAKEPCFGCLREVRDSTLDRDGSADILKVVETARGSDGVPEEAKISMPTTPIAYMFVINLGGAFWSSMSPRFASKEMKNVVESDSKMKRTATRSKQL